MPMIVNDNMAAINTLTQLSKNQSSLSKSLAKLAQSMKINNSADDPANYQIPERIKEKIRMLDQNNQDNQNADSKLEILRILKEKAINAANETGTDTDREAVQKEINASVQQIDDNALLTFNGKLLINGARTSTVIQTIQDGLDQIVKMGNGDVNNNVNVNELNPENSPEVLLIGTENFSADNFDFIGA